MNSLSILEFKFSSCFLVFITLGIAMSIVAIIVEFVELWGIQAFATQYLGLKPVGGVL